MLQLKVNDKLFGGWTEVNLTRGINQLASTFELIVTDRWNNVNWTLKAFDECEILWKGQPILTGYIDQNAISYSEQDHRISIKGRSKTADLVDCSANGGQFKKQTFLQIAQALCQPFGINVVSEVSGGDPFLSWKPDEGVQVFEALEQLARLRGFLLTDNGAGGLVITQASTQRITTVLELGKNILSGSGQFDVKDRFSEYIVKGQQKGGDNLTADYAAHSVATVKDTLVPRHRPLIIQVEDQADIATAQKRAQWEANIHFGLSQKFSYKVQGWEHADGLWQPNRLVHVKDELMGLDTDLIISSVSYSLNSLGSFTELTLAHPKAFLNEPITPQSTQTQSTTKTSSSIVWQELGQ